MNKYTLYAVYLLLSLPCFCHAVLHELVNKVRPSILQKHIVRRYVVDIKLSPEDRAATRQRLAELEVQKGCLTYELQQVPLSSYRLPDLSGSVHEDFVRKSLEDVQEEIRETKNRLAGSN